MSVKVLIKTHRTLASVWRRSVPDGFLQYLPNVGLPNEVLSVLTGNI